MLGLGGGWFEREHDAFGLDFGSGFGERLDRLDEAVGLIRRLLDGETVTHDGRFYDCTDARLRAAPGPGAAADPHRRLRAATKTLRTTAPLRGPVERLRRARADRGDVGASCDERCEEIGRPFDEIERTVTIHAVIRDTAAAADAAWAEIAARPRSRGSRRARTAPTAASTVGGSPAELAELRRRLPPRPASARSSFVFRDPFDLETIERSARSARPWRVSRPMTADGGAAGYTLARDASTVARATDRASNRRKRCIWRKDRGRSGLRSCIEAHESGAAATRLATVDTPDARASADLASARNGQRSAYRARADPSRAGQPPMLIITCLMNV